MEARRGSPIPGSSIVPRIAGNRASFAIILSRRERIGTRASLGTAAEIKILWPISKDGIYVYFFIRARFVASILIPALITITNLDAGECYESTGDHFQIIVKSGRVVA